MRRVARLFIIIILTNFILLACTNENRDLDKIKYSYNLNSKNISLSIDSDCRLEGEYEDIESKVKKFDMVINDNLFKRVEEITKENKLDSYRFKEHVGEFKDRNKPGVFIELYYKNGDTVYIYEEENNLSREIEGFNKSMDSILVGVLDIDI